MKTLIRATILISLAASVACGKKSSNSGNSTPVTTAACNQSVQYDQYGRPIQSCINTNVAGQPYNQYGYNNQYGYGYNNGYGGTVGTTGNPCQNEIMRWGVYYQPMFINGQWWCVQPGMMQQQGRYY